MHHCTLAVECMTVVLSGMGVLSGGWFLHRIGISIIHGTLCLDREIQTIIQTLPLARFVFVFVFPVQNKAWHLLHTYETDLWVYRSLHYSIVTSRVTGC